VLDKTGTITQGKPAVTDAVAFGGGAEDQVLALAAAAEKGSEHPLGAAIVEGAAVRGLALEEARGFQATPGRGIEAGIGRRAILLGNEAFLASHAVDVSAARAALADLSREGKTMVLLAMDGALAGVIAVADPIKLDAAHAIARLRALGMAVAMVTGDHPQTAAAVAKGVGITQVEAGVLPEGKANYVRGLQASGQRVAMVGDGINDAPALAQADLGIAIGTGTDVAKAAADVTLLGGDLNHIVTAIELSRATMRIIRQNLFWAFIYNIIFIPLAAGVFYPLTGWMLSPMIASAAMSFSSVSVVLNSLRLRRFAPAAA
jgi:Cu+-exporting ATPase